MSKRVFRELEPLIMDYAKDSDILMKSLLKIRNALFPKRRKQLLLAQAQQGQQEETKEERWRKSQAIRNDDSFITGNYSEYQTYLNEELEK